MTDEMPRFAFGWRRVRRPAGDGGFGVPCYVPVERILAIEAHEEGFGWTAVMDFHGADGRLVIVDDIRTEIVRGLTGEDKPALDRPIFDMPVGDDMQPGPAKAWKRRVRVV